MDSADFASLLEREPAPGNVYTLELEGRLAQEIKRANLAETTQASQASRIKSLEDVLVAVRGYASALKGTLPTPAAGPTEERRMGYATAIISLINETLDPCKPWCDLAEGHEGACMSADEACDGE